MYVNHNGRRGFGGRVFALVCFVAFYLPLPAPRATDCTLIVWSTYMIMEDLCERQNLRDPRTTFNVVFSHPPRPQLM